LMREMEKMSRSPYLGRQCERACRIGLEELTGGPGIDVERDRGPRVAQRIARGVDPKDAKVFADELGERASAPEGGEHIDPVRGGETLGHRGEPRGHDEAPGSNAPGEHAPAEPG